MIFERFCIAGIILFCDTMAGVYYRKAFRTISLKMILEHGALISALLSLFILVPGIPREIILISEAVLIYYDHEQLHTGHTILNVWERRFILGIVIVWMLLFMGVGITGSVLGAGIAVRIFYILLSFADRTVRKVRGTDIELGDLEGQALRTAITVSGGYKGVLDVSSAVILALSAVQVMCIYRLFGSASYPPFERLLYLAIGVGGLILIVHSPLLTLLKISYYEFVNIDGVLPNFLLEWRSRLFDSVPKGYSEDIVRRVSERYPADSVSGDMTRPDIIAVMNESFADLRVNGSFEVTRPVMPYYDLMKSNINAFTGFAHVSVLGGNTAYSEYEFLTGDTSKFYRYCPYSSKMMPTGLDIHALPSHMKDLGYRTIAMHSYLRENWRRPTAYGNLGFEEQYYIDDFPEENIRKVRSFCSDESHYREIIRRMEESRDDRPVFFFNVTMQNHGGYAPVTEGIDRIEVRAKGMDLPEAGTYETLMSLSDSALRILTDYLSKRERPAILLVFGDHQPKLPAGFMDAVTGHPESVMTEEEKDRLYTTPYLIWSNRPLDRRLAVSDISLNYMGGYLMKVAGLPLTGYMKYLENMRSEKKVISRREGEASPEYEALIYAHIRGGVAGNDGFF
ncbi:MAG: LTA synthase family protein [Lachnospiraceae bacterium]|nr:LTA synthase family protein [Lachnospiraceae bacterium]